MSLVSVKTGRRTLLRGGAASGARGIPPRVTCAVRLRPAGHENQNRAVSFVWPVAQKRLDGAPSRPVDGYDTPCGCRADCQPSIDGTLE